MPETYKNEVSAYRSLILPLALGQFICSYAATNMNVAISAIAYDLGTTVSGIQLTITLFTLTMAALMIPGSKLTDIWGRKFCFRIGLIVYGLGGLIATLAPSLGLLTVGYSLLEGIGSALLIPPIYILLTVSFPDVKSRAKSFGIISAAAGIGAAAGPLIGGLITSGISWRASFLVQVLVVLYIIFLTKRIADPELTGPKPHFDLIGAILSAAGLFFIVLGILLSSTYGWFRAEKDFSIGSKVLIPVGGISPVWVAVAVGAVILLSFFLHIRSRERHGKEPLISTHIFRNCTSNLGLVTQNVQWLIMQGSFFVISVFLQTIRGFNAISTGLILTPTTIGILVSSMAARRLAYKYSQRALIRWGFAITIVGMVLLVWLASATSPIFNFVPGLLLMGLGIGIMLTSSVNVVQSAFPEKDQGEISGLSRSVSNLGSALGTSIVGSVLLTTFLPQTQTFGLALITLVVISAIGLVAALLLPADKAQSEEASTAGESGS
ncbi:MAG: MFS transporter [Methanotrichaceae archaeon]|nr:MFS transporter [Methanotrichaceae archaeon]